MRRSERGQTLVLAALSFLVLAVMVTLSFNLSQALRAKTSLQQHSDTLAYSMAVMEARALNYYAVTNRAIAASYVAMNSLHAYMAAASVTGEMMRAGKENFSIIALQELAMCGKIKHCKHAKKARGISKDYAKAAKDSDDKVRALEPSFRASMEALDRMVDELHASQRRVHAQTREALEDGRSHGLRQLALYNAPGVSDLTEGVGAINVNEFDCVVDGMSCSGSVPSSSPKVRARVMTEIANATRPGWPARRAGLIGGGVPKYLHPRFLFQLTMGIPGMSLEHKVVGHAGTAKTVQSQDALHGGQDKENEGSTLGAHEHGALVNWWNAHTAPVSRQYQAQVASDSRGGRHAPGRAHQGQHRFEGVNAKAFEVCSASGNCFMKFRANPDPRRDWGQPRVYSYVTQQLRIGDPGKAPWELNASGQVSLTHGEQGEAQLTLAPGEGAGLSKALVYYHRFAQGELPGGGGSGDLTEWQEPPNLFAPYWRAKLHPFTPDQAEQVLRAAGDSEGAQIVSGAQGLSL